MAKVYIKFPKTGLGNMMLVWARGLVFARLNNLELVTSSWWGIHWGALLRREKKNRLYWEYFIETPLSKRLTLKASEILMPVEYDPLIIKYEQLPAEKIFVFNKVVRDNDLFKDIRDYKDLIQAELYKILHPKLKAKLLKYTCPVISIHIRRGDFTLGNQTTPLAFFIEGIRIIRETLKKDVSITIFTDAKKEEISEILALPQVFLAEEKPDILDIILMSKSKIIILSQSSTFSYWGAFFSEATIIRPVNDWQYQIRCPQDNIAYNEIKWDVNQPESSMQLRQALQSRNYLYEL